MRDIKYANSDRPDWTDFAPLAQLDTVRRLCRRGWRVDGSRAGDVVMCAGSGDRASPCLLVDTRGYIALTRWSRHGGWTFAGAADFRAIRMDRAS